MNTECHGTQSGLAWVHHGPTVIEWKGGEGMLVKVLPHIIRESPR